MPGKHFQFILAGLRQNTTNNVRHYATKRAPWTAEESEELLTLVKKNGKCWKKLQVYFPGRTSSSLTGRYNNLTQKYSQTEDAPSVKSKKRVPWSKDEDSLLLELTSEIGLKWTRIANHFNNRNSGDIMQRYNRIRSKEIREVNDGLWSIEEIKKLETLIDLHGENWTLIAAKMKTRSVEQCKSRHRYSTQHQRLLVEHEQKIKELIEKHGIHDFAKIQSELEVPAIDEHQLRKYYWSELDPSIQKGDWSDREIEDMILLLKELDGSMELVQRRLHVRRSLKDLWDQYYKHSAKLPQQIE